MAKEKVVIWGAGRNWHNYREQLQAAYDIVVLLDNKFNEVGVGVDTIPCAPPRIHKSLRF